MSLIRTYINLRKTVNIADLFIFLAIAAFLFGLLLIVDEWAGVLRPVVKINLSPSALPEYTFYSFVRGFMAYLLSLVFTIIYGLVAAKNKNAERFMIPLLDILQSIPVLGFLPGIVLSLVTLFPQSNIGLELAAVLMIFTGQVWNMAFSFYQSLQSIPEEFQEAAKIYRFNWWQKFSKLELPYSANGLVWNSMMSMAGGWFFLTVCEAFVLGDKDFRLPGIGSYMSVAINEGNVQAIIYAIIAMMIMIVALDRLFWKPIVGWVQKFKYEEVGGYDVQNSFILNALQRSGIIRFTRRITKALIFKQISPIASRITNIKRPIDNIFNFDRYKSISKFFPILLYLIVGIFLFSGLLHLINLIWILNLQEWLHIIYTLLLTLLRVTAAIVLGSLWTIPVGILIGTNKKLSRVFQPIIQIAASFPAPMIFPLVIILFTHLNFSIEFGSVFLMMLGTQWYILFNIISGAMSIPNELKEVAVINRFGKLQRWRRLFLPAIFPSLVTGWVTASGGAWNASIIAEYINFSGKTLIATGIGATITKAAGSANFHILAASILILSTTVVAINRVLWKKLYRITSNIYRIEK